MAGGVGLVATVVVALHPCSLFFLFLDRKLRLDLLLLLEELVQSLLGFLQLLLQLFLFWRVRLCLAELLEIALDFLVLVVDELCDLLQGERWVFAGIVVLVTLGGFNDFEVLCRHLRDDVNHL